MIIKVLDTPRETNTLSIIEFMEPTMVELSATIQPSNAK